jgi:hypothetical protein
MAKALGLVVQVADQGLVYVINVVDELYAAQRAGWGAVHASAKNKKVAPASPMAMAKRMVVENMHPNLMNGEQNPIITKAMPM